MLYNTKLKKVQSIVQCLNCEHYNPKTGECNGINKVCFEYDKLTNTIIDNSTLMATKLEDKKEN